MSALNRRKVIAIDARVVMENHGHGIARYTDEFLRHLTTLPTAYSFVILVNRRSPLMHAKWPPHFKLRVMRSGWINFIWGQLELAFVLWQVKPDLFHSPSFIVPFLSSTPLVTTIHDLNHVVLAENYTFLHRFYYSFFLARKIRSARSVVTVSAFSKAEIVNFFRIPANIVKVIHNGINSRFTPTARDDQSALESVQERYELPPAFIMSSGNRKPHKNICRLVEAYCSGDFELPLVLLTDFDPRILEISQRYHKKHKIHFLRFVSNDDIPYVYGLAKVFVYPSLYEGFGLPPLEAAACGVPVVVSDRTSLPEVMADCALYVNPEDVQSIRQGIETALARSQEIEGNVSRGLKLAGRFSWTRMAEETLQAYVLALGDSAHEPA